MYPAASAGGYEELAELAGYVCGAVGPPTRVDGTDEKPGATKWRSRRSSVDFAGRRVALSAGWSLRAWDVQVSGRVGFFGA